VKTADLLDAYPDAGVCILQLRSFGAPSFSASASRPSAPIHDPAASSAPARSTFGEATFAPGDQLHGDEDGVIVLLTSDGSADR